MSILDYSASKICKYEVLAEISFHTNISKNRKIKLLCSRLLARHRLSKYDILDHKCSDGIDADNGTNSCKDLNINMDFQKKNEDSKSSKKVIDASKEEGYTNKFSLNDDTYGSREKLKREDAIICSQQINDECLILQEQYSNLNINESQLYAKWYEYWENNGIDFVNETWVKQYGSCTTDDFQLHSEELYKKHTEQQYVKLYWKFINKMSFTTEGIQKITNEISENNDSISKNNEEFHNDNHTTNFDFLYKYKNFQQLNNKLIKAYRALSIIGFVYDDPKMLNSAFVEYLKTNIVKSTRELNVYRYPKKTELNNYCNKTYIQSLDVHLDPENSNTYNENKQGEIYKDLLVSNTDNHMKNKNKLKKEKKKQKRDQYIKLKKEKHIEHLKRLGYDYLQNDPKLMKFWKKRHILFSEFEKGIQLDKESWFSVTPEIISTHIAERCSCYLIVDPFCGAGGNIIQFAKSCELVVAIDKDPKKIEMARHNAELYGVADRIQFIIGDYFTLAPTLKADVIFLSPPWGGPDLMNLEEYKLSYLMPENGGIENMLSLARQITLNVALHLPKNTNIFDCLKFVDDGFVEVQQNMLNSRYNSLTVYYSELYGLCDEKTDIYDN